MWKHKTDGNLFTYASYKNKKMTGCIVLELTRDLKNTILTLIFIWIDKKYPKLWKEYLKFANQKAKELGVTKLQINTSRNPDVIKKRLGKYGFTQRYVIFEKTVDKKDVN